MLRGKKVMHLFDDPAFDYLPGESVIIPANELMRIDFPEATLDKPTQCLALAIDNQKILNTLDLLNEKYPKEGRKDFWKLDELNYFFYNNDELAQTINKIINICRSTDISKDALADLALQELLVRIIQTQTLKQLESNKSKSTNTYLTHIVGMIQGGLTDKLNLKVLAQNSGMSTASLYRLFKRELGISPVEYIILERIKLAKKLLKNQDVYIKNVSFETGFDDCNYFIRTFKYYEGITPKQYQILSGKG
jgi:AraC-like DNA-binding protein